VFAAVHESECDSKGSFQPTRFESGYWGDTE